MAVLMISSELPEVLGMADRVLVLREGRLVAELSRAEADEDSIMRAATGQDCRGRRMSAARQRPRTAPAPATVVAAGQARRGLLRARELGIAHRHRRRRSGVTTINNHDFARREQRPAVAHRRRR